MGVKQKLEKAVLATFKAHTAKQFPDLSFKIFSAFRLTLANGDATYVIPVRRGPAVKLR